MEHGNRLRFVLGDVRNLAREKVHEILVSEEELARTERRGDYLVTHLILPELRVETPGGSSGAFTTEYSSASALMSLPELRTATDGKEADNLARRRSERAIPMRDVPPARQRIGVLS